MSWRAWLIVILSWNAGASVGSDEKLLFSLACSENGPSCFHFTSYPCFIKVLCSGKHRHTVLYSNSCNCTTWKRD